LYEYTGATSIRAVSLLVSDMLCTCSDSMSLCLCRPCRVTILSWAGVLRLCCIRVSALAQSWSGVHVCGNIQLCYCIVVHPLKCEFGSDCRVNLDTCRCTAWQHICTTLEAAVCAAMNMILHMIDRHNSYLCVLCVCGGSTMAMSTGSDFMCFTAV
jgi:hypothetical protein